MRKPNLYPLTAYRGRFLRPAEFSTFTAKGIPDRVAIYSETLTENNRILAKMFASVRPAEKEF